MSGVPAHAAVETSARRRRGYLGRQRDAALMEYLREMAQLLLLLLLLMLLQGRVEAVVGGASVKRRRRGCKRRMRSLALHQIQTRRRILSRFRPDLTRLLLLLLLLLLLWRRWREDAWRRVFAALFDLLLGGAGVTLNVFA